MNYWLAIVQHGATAFLLALSCYLVLRAGQISFGQQAFFGIGAYAGGWASAMLDWPLFAALGVGTVVAAAMATLAGLSLCRSSGFRFTLMTLVLGEFVRELLGRLHLVRLVDGRTVGMEGVLGFGGIERYAQQGITVAGQAAIALLAAALALGAVLLLERGPIGRRIRAAACDPGLAAYVGIDPVRARLFAFVAAGAVAGLGGALFAHQATYIEPANFSLMSGVHAVAYALLGGVGSALGPIVGTVVDVGLLEALRVTGPYRMVSFGLLIVLMLVLFPRGALGHLRLVHPKGQGGKILR